MRCSFPLPPEEDVDLQVLVREAPETLAVLRAGGLDPIELGTRRVGELGTDLRKETRRATEWREGAVR